MRTFLPRLFLCLCVAPTIQAATIVVRSTADSGPGSLRAAIAAAGSNDIIQFGLPVPATITLTSGEIAVPMSVTLKGPGATNLTITSNYSSRIFHIQPYANVTLSGLTLDKASVPNDFGGAIFNEHGSLLVNNCTLTNNSGDIASAAYAGGSIYNAGGLVTMNGCLITGTVFSYYGGAIYNNGGTVTAWACAISNNISRFGGAIYNNSGCYELDGCTVADNRVYDRGGAVFNADGSIILNNSVISSNHAGYTRDGSGSVGDGIYNGSAMSLVNCTITDNGGSSFGGGIYNDGGYGGNAVVSLTGCTFNANSVTENGGGIYNGGLSSGSAAKAIVSLLNCTLANNTANGTGGAIYNEESLTTVSCTFYNNSAGAGSSINNSGTSGSGSAIVYVGSTIFKGNGGGSALANSGAINSYGYNLSDDDSGPSGGAGDRSGTDPLLDPSGLKSNGGPTQTVALQPNSPALDQGKRDLVFSLRTTVDQRGQSRTVHIPGIINPPGGDGTDIGAYESAAPTPASTPTVTLSVSPTTVGKGGIATLTVMATAAVTQPIIVNYTMSGNATVGIDYTLNGSPNQFVIPTGQSSATVTLTVTTSKTAGKEKVTITLLPGSGYDLPAGSKKRKAKPPQVTVTIQNR
jgi:hypothetical protein